MKQVQLTVTVTVPDDAEPAAVVDLIEVDGRSMVREVDVRVTQPPGRIVLVTGNPADGFVLGGPFRTSDEAITWAETNYDDGGDTDWWVMEVEDVEPDEPAAPAAAAPVPETAFEF